MKNLMLYSIALSSLLTVALEARADTLYNTFGTAGTFDLANFWGVGGREDAVPFQLTQTRNLTSVSLALVANGSYTVVIRGKDVAGLPGNSLLQFSTSGTGGKETFSVGSPLSLSPGTYWVSATSSTTGGWYWNNVPVSGNFATRSGGAWSTVNNLVLPVLQVDFQPVPEPATLAALGLGTVTLLRRRRRQGRTP